MVYIFSDIKQEVADEIENIEKWAEENGKKLVIEYKTKKDKKSTNQENPPLPENQEMEEEPFPDFQETENQNSANQYINNTKDKNINLNNTNLEEEEVSSHSELISFLLSNDITKENAVKFETRLLEESLTGYTNDQVLEAIEWSLYQFVEGKCDEPYIYAVGRLKRVLDNKVKKVTNKPKQQKGTGFTRKEMLPNWFDETKQTTPVAQVENLSDQKAEIERMLQELRT